MSFFFIYNGEFFKEGTSVITPDNHSFRYGDGLFETIKAAPGKLILEHYHFERLFNGLKILGFDLPPGFTPLFLKEEITKVRKKNGHTTYARIRLVVFRGNGNLSSPENQIPNYIIQTWAADDFQHLNITGLSLDLYKKAKKSCDDLSGLKTNNFLIYALAAIHAKNNNLDDCILLNNHERICDTSVANIFIIKGRKIFTPPLSEGCIAGVRRRWLLEKMKNGGNDIIEKPLGLKDLYQADEVFLTNSLHPLRWVGQFQNTIYTHSRLQGIYTALSKTF